MYQFLRNGVAYMYLKIVWSFVKIEAASFFAEGILMYDNGTPKYHCPFESEVLPEKESDPRKHLCPYEDALMCSKYQAPPDLYATVDGEDQKLVFLPYEIDLAWLKPEKVYKKAFQLVVPLKEQKNYAITFHADCGELGDLPVNAFHFEKYSPLYDSNKWAFFEENGWLLRHDPPTHALTLAPAEESTYKCYMKQYRRSLRKKLKLLDREKLLYSMRLMRKYNREEHRRIWLISDRIDRGDDNGEAFMQYLSTVKDSLPDVDLYFVLQKNCPDAERISKFATLVEPLSREHRILHLKSEYIISSQMNNPVINPFNKMQSYYRPLTCHKKFVFLQHGITKDNQSPWLNRYNRNLYGFVVSTHQEYQSVFEYNYYYGKEQNWLTGMPRFDRLFHNEQKMITIMPTWRKSLMNGNDAATGIWKKGDDFDTSEYVLFYDRLLNDETLIAYCKSHGYQLCFMPHPIIEPYVEGAFHKHPDVTFFPKTKSYRDIFSETDLLVTDYSSVAFDFAYLRKPVLYCHFDRDEFFNGSHSYKEGYFDYEKDGFGPICLSVEETVAQIMRNIDQNCKLEDTYRQRIDQTFAYSDTNNCKRVLEQLYQM